MEMEFTTRLSLDETVSRLQRAAGAAARLRAIERLRPHLEGEVSPTRVVLYRQRGVSTWFGRFEGAFVQDGMILKLKGRFVRQPPILLYLWSGLLLSWAALLTVTVIVRWQGPDSIAWLVAALFATAVGAATIWFRAHNVRAEAAMLSSEIVESLGRPDV
jgi:hypothetical protein